jgi:hypothetical protein
MHANNATYTITTLVCSRSRLLLLPHYYCYTNTALLCLSVNANIAAATVATTTAAVLTLYHTAIL